jgi:hypothetical protein
VRQPEGESTAETITVAPIEEIAAHPGATSIMAQSFAWAGSQVALGVQLGCGRKFMPADRFA